MTKRLFLILFVIIVILSGCSFRNKEVQNTLFFFYPWSTNLTYYFEYNIANFESALSDEDLESNKVVVFISQTDSTACMYEIKRHRGRCLHDTIVRFENYNYKYTSVEGLSDLLELAKGREMTSQFSIVIGCHGDAWIPARDMKRSFGGIDVESRIDIATLSGALKKSNLIAEFILFDDCYMSSIEVAYELRDVCRYLIASPAEIMAAGMPFNDIAQDLLGTPNYSGICADFYNYYANHSSVPYGAIAITRCCELENLAEVMRRVNAIAVEPNYEVQFYDGYTPHIFYDLGDYVSAICSDKVLLEEFCMQMEKCVPYKAHTPRIYVYGVGTIEVNNYSGISTSAPSLNSKCASYQETEWFKSVMY